MAVQQKRRSVSTEPELVFGQVPIGWQARHWCERLEQMAQSCEPVQPCRAQYLRAWATDIRRRIRAGPPPASSETPIPPWAAAALRGPGRERAPARRPARK